MIRKQYMTLASFAAAPAAVTLYSMGYGTAAGFTALAGFFLPSKDLMRFTGPLQFLAFWLNGFVLAVLLGLPFSHYPWLGFAVVVATFSVMVRFHAWAPMGYTSHAWVEVVSFLLAAGHYVYGNLSLDYGWQGWAVPGPLLAFAAYNAIGTVFGRTYMIKKARAGYAAETGKPAPDFTLPDHEGNPVSLSSYLGLNHLLLIFVTGDWCPGCHMLLRTYEKHRDRFRKHDVVVMAIGPDPVGVNRDMVNRLGLRYHVLSDEQQQVAGMYGIRIQKFPGAPAHQDHTPLPASFLVCNHGVVRYSSRPDRPGEFLNPGLIFPVLDSLRQG